MFKGAFTALITPFTRDGSAIDEEAFVKLVKRQVEAGIHGLVPSGTTGESPTLDHEEHARVVSLCVEAANKQVPVLAGAGSNSTHEAVMMAQHAEEAGADAILVVTPYYNKPTQEGLYLHFRAIAESTSLPIILYNIPGRSVIDMTDETIARVVKDCPSIVGIKDATGDLERPCRLQRYVGSGFYQLSGDDSTALAFNAQGGHGCISVSSNVMPKECAQLHNSWMEGDLKKAQELHSHMMPLHLNMFCESNPVPAKYAASLMGLCEETVRLPLAPLSDENRQVIRSTLEALSLI